MHKPEEPYVPKPGAKYESDDIKLRPVIRGLLFFFAFTAGAGIITAGIFQLLVPGGFGSNQDALHRRLPPPSTPLIQGSLSVKKAIADMRATETAGLSRLGWVDRSKGVVEIPIDSAMDLVAKRGLPEWPAARNTGAKTPANGGVK